jgi:hypothetical protein
MNRESKLPFIAAAFIALLPVSGRSDPHGCAAQMTTFASGLPKRLAGFSFGGPVDVARARLRQPTTT